MLPPWTLSMTLLCLTSSQVAALSCQYVTFDRGGPPRHLHSNCSIPLPQNVQKLVISDGKKLASLNALRNLTRESASIKYLCLSDNRITKIPDNIFQNLPLLTHIDISSNNITHINRTIFVGSTKLWKVILNGNKLKSPGPILISNSIRWLELGNCDLSNLNENYFIGVPNLVYLNLIGNYLGNGYLNGLRVLPDLRFLHLERNNITVLQQDVFASNTKLEWLYLNENPLIFTAEYLFPTATSVLKLYLGGCGIEKLPANLFQNASNLHSLDLQNNNLESFESNVVSHLQNVRHIDVSRNKLTSVTFQDMISLEFIDISNNKIGHSISDQNFVNLPNLNHLNLHHNYISELTLTSLHSLTYLDISMNQIYSASVDGLTKLEFLNISENLIQCNENLVESKILCSKAKIFGLCDQTLELIVLLRTNTVCNRPLNKIPLTILEKTNSSQIKDSPKSPKNLTISETVEVFTTDSRKDLEKEDIKMVPVESNSKNKGESMWWIVFYSAVGVGGFLCTVFIVSLTIDCVMVRHINYRRMKQKRNLQMKKLTTQKRIISKNHPHDLLRGSRLGNKTDSPDDSDGVDAWVPSVNPQPTTQQRDMVDGIVQDCSDYNKSTPTSIPPASPLSESSRTRHPSIMDRWPFCQEPPSTTGFDYTHRLRQPEEDPKTTRQQDIDELLSDMEYLASIDYGEDQTPEMPRRQHWPSAPGFQGASQWTRRENDTPEWF